MKFPTFRYYNKYGEQRFLIFRNKKDVLTYFTLNDDY